jgi:hypothetical protein
MWYYEIQGQKKGPVNKDVILGLFHNGAIDGETKVCRDGEQEWINLAETDVYQLPGSAAIPLDQKTNVHPHRVKPSKLKALYIWWMVLYLVSLFISLLIAPLTRNSMVELATGLNCIILPVTITSLILDFILLYKYWEINQDGYSLTSPGKAIGFLFIPLFNIFWIFISIGGLASDQNRYIDRNFAEEKRGKVRRAHPWVWIVYLVFAIVIFLFTFSLFMMEKPVATYSLILLGSSTIMGIIRIIMFTDFYLTANSILKNGDGLLSTTA